MLVYLHVVSSVLYFLLSVSLIRFILMFMCRFFLNSICMGMWRVWVRRGGFIGSWWGNRWEGDHWGDLGVDVCTILPWISRRWDVGIWTGLGWLRIEIGGGRL